MADRRAHLGFGIDIGGTGIKGALVDLRDGSLASDRFRLDTPRPSTPPAVAQTAGLVAGNVDYSGPVGVTFPGVVMHGTVLTAANVDESWVGTSLVETVGPLQPGPVTALNDADAAGLAEVRYGAGEKQSGLVIMVTLGTGIGTALIHDGILVPNAELGHMEVDGHDAETRASVAARERRGMTWEQWARKVQKYLRRLEDLLWPELFILGGGVSKKPDKWFGLIETRTPKVIATLANNAGIVGAALAAAEAKPPAGPRSAAPRTSSRVR
ncbi:MAG TPA: ROK family protein [Nakamurella sp.]|nr:ROK family protein [Nakamurella sp.]